MRTIEEIKSEIAKVEKSKKAAESKLKKCGLRIAELEEELITAEER